MKIYKVKVNGKVYEVELEAVTENDKHIENTKPENSNVNVEGNNINAPIGGKIIKLNVNVGDNVKKGDVVAIIEAMKLENEVVSPFDGKITNINVKAGDTVNNKDVLLTLK